MDDQEANTEILADLLEMEDYIHVKTITDSRQVLDIVKGWNPDIILLDLMMPFFNGYDIMKMIRAMLRSNEFLPILVLTADISEDTKRKALSEGATDFLAKPFELVEVTLRIRNLLHTRYLFRQLQNQNQVLDQKVQERTEQLALINKELNEAYERIQASDRFKTNFINNISHEIRTPLNGILGFSQIIAENEIPQDEKAVYLKKIFDSSTRLIKTITNYIDISNLMSGTQMVVKKEIRPDIILTLVADEFQMISMEKKIPVEIDIPGDDLCKLNSDSEILRKILYQLLDNALKFIKEGSVRMGFNVKEDRLLFFVEDTGIGVAEKHQKNIFDAFVQEDAGSTRAFEGNGLGLTIAKQFVELLEGNIWMKSTKGEGTSVFFELPGVIHKRIENKTIPPNEAEKKLQRYTILVVEDDSLNFLYVSHLLDKPNVELLHAHDGAEAVKLARDHNDITIILMDLRMPVMDGFTATTQIKQLLPQVPIIAVTAYSGVEYEQRAFDAGCDDVILKPTKQAVLYRTLAKYSVVI